MLHGRGSHIVVNIAVCFEAGSFINSLVLQHSTLLQMEFDFLFCTDIYGMTLLQTHIHDAHLSNCEHCLSKKITDTEDIESVCQRKQFSAFKVTKITSQKVAPSQDLVGFQSFPMTRPTVCRLCPCSIHLLVLNHSVIWHKISSMCSMSTTSMTRRTTKRNKNKMSSEKKQTKKTCPYLIMFILYYYNNGSLKCVPMMFLSFPTAVSHTITRIRHFVKNKSHIKPRQLWKETRQLNKITSTSSVNHKLTSDALGHAENCWINFFSF